MLSLTPLALHSLHSICSGRVSVSGGAWCVHVPTRGRILGEVIEQGEDLFDFLKNLLCTGLWECIILGEGKTLLGECLLCFWLLSSPRFPSSSSMTASSITSVFEESCFDFWSIASSRCPCLRGSIYAWVSDWYCLSELFVTSLSSSLSCFYFITSLFSGGVLTMHS